MSLLIITNNPDRASFKQRIEVYLAKLGESGVDCEVARLPAGTFARRRLFKRAAEFDGVFLHKKALNPLNAVWLSEYGKKVLYDFDDAIMYDDHDAQTPDRKRKKAFQRTVKLADMVIAGNSYLAEHAREFNSNVAVIPTGLDTSAYKVQASPIKDGKIRLVWIGSSSTLRYLAEIKTALEEIGSRLDNVILRIICDEFLDLKNMKVEKVQWSFQNQAIDLVASDIGLAPLPDNAFTRGKCGFKILQYAAAGLPAVASPVGVNAQYASNGVTGFHATNTAEWVTSISRLIENAELRKTMGCQARLWVTSFDVDIIGKRLIGMIEESMKSDEYHDKDRP